MGGMTSSDTETPVTGVTTFVGIIDELPPTVAELVDGITERII